jgi:hypothetical protein
MHELVNATPLVRAKEKRLTFPCTINIFNERNQIEGKIVLNKIHDPYDYPSYDEYEYIFPIHKVFDETLVGNIQYPAYATGRWPLHADFMECTKDGC